MENEKGKGLTNILIESLGVAISTLILQYLLLIISADIGAVTISNSCQGENKFLSNISVKNYQSNSYLENIVIDISKDIKITSIEGITYNYTIDNNEITIDKIRPDDVVNIVINSDEKLTENNLKVISSNQKIGLTNLDVMGSLQKNIITSVVLNAIIMFITYGIVLYIMNRFSLSKINKANELMTKVKEKDDELIEENKNITIAYNDCRDENLRLVNQIGELIKKIDNMEIDFLSKVKDLSSEIDFYKGVLKNGDIKVKTSSNTIKYLNEKVNEKKIKDTN